jgi:hypothetical protein
VARATDKAGGEVHCYGVNECKGKGACAGADNACKAQNSCKGKGFVDVNSADECTKQGGTLTAPKKL